MIVSCLSVLVVFVWSMAAMDQLLPWETNCLVMSVHKHGPSYTTIFQDKRSLRYTHTYTLSKDLT